ncbi:hypothetical protein AVEN_271971-1 [Araneus ventricosus]|uniref:Uncharacterized protein n=1 Tax=Araneus ventricosus TaxID=182803 RepID=A0A4Y2CBS4_ARAVE|nr:hypothetical protein AVEN_271971-1 [Araneus ventricosus]
MPQVYVEPLTYLELYSRRKAFVNISWRHPPAHSWYRSEGPGATIHFKGDRKDQTALARLSSGHLKTLRFFRADIFDSFLHDSESNEQSIDKAGKVVKASTWKSSENSVPELRNKRLGRVGM